MAMTTMPTTMAHRTTMTVVPMAVVTMAVMAMAVVAMAVVAMAMLHQSSEAILDLALRRHYWN